MARKINTKSYNYRLGRNIARIRTQQTGYSQAEMEIYTGISRAYYGRIELGLHSPTIDILQKIANALNVPFLELFLDENNKPI